MNILYYIQIAFIREYKKPCFKEPILATKKGPQISKIRRKYLFWSSIPIQNTYFILIKHKSLIDKTIEETRDLFIWNIVHDKESAWYAAYSNNQSAISYELMDIMRK